MAYVPPHKRHSQGDARLPLNPEVLQPHIHRNLSRRSPVSGAEKSDKFVQADHAICKLLFVGLDYDVHLPSYVHLEPNSLEAFERGIGGKPVTLVNKNRAQDNTAGTPWATVAEQVLQDLRSSFETLKNHADNQGLEQIKPSLVVRPGNIHFHQTNSARTVVNGQLEEAELKNLRRSFYTGFPSSYLQYVLDEQVPKTGLDFVDEKERYGVKLSDKTRPDITITCKCSVTNDESLMLYKVELNPVRQMVYHVSCLDKDLDMRIMLYTKSILKDLSENELNSIRDLINSAVLDSNVKGGLRWPLGKSSGDRFVIICFWRVTDKKFRNQSVLLKVRDTDWFDLSEGTGEATRAVNLKLKGVVSQLQEQGTRSDTVSGMLKDNLKLIWDNFLSYELK